MLKLLVFQLSTFQNYNKLKQLQIVLGDKSEQKAFKYTGITCFNPGSFSSDGTFIAYRPCTQEVELSDANNLLGAL